MVTTLDKPAGLIVTLPLAVNPPPAVINPDEFVVPVIVALLDTSKVPFNLVLLVTSNVVILVTPNLVAPETSNVPEKVVVR
jgi:hypothetical protein